MKISACWIVKNEEANIARSIKSIQEIVDELIVVDTGSTDSTVEVARALGAKTDFFEWNDDFSAARNYALSLAAGELIFFLDADEWFEPKLGREERRVLEQIFATSAWDAARVNISHINMQTGLLIGKSAVTRIIRKRKDIRYRNKVHEEPRKAGNNYLDTALIEDWNLNHSGYTGDAMPEKTERNVKLLENSVKMDPDNPDIFKQYFYLMREYNNDNQYEKAYPYFLKLKQDRKEMKNFSASCPDLAAHYFYMGLGLTSHFRERFSRRELYDALVLTMKRLLPNYPGSDTIHLVYQYCLDMKEDRFMKDLEISVKAAAKKGTAQNTYYKGAQARLFAYAAMAAWRRGKKEKAFEYAGACFTQNDDFIQYDVLGILLNCLKGQPAADIILFLNSIFSTANEEKLSWMIKGLQMEGYSTLYIYYIKKQLEQGTVATDGYLLLLILLGRYEEAVKVGLSQYDEIPSIIRDNIFLAAICSGNEVIYRDNMQYLEGYAHILEAFFANRRLETIKEEDERILLHHYKSVAFTGGVEKAERLLNVFRASPVLCFLTKARYCIHNGLFEEVLKEDVSFLREDDFTSHELLVRCYSATGRYSEALNVLERFIESGLLRQDLFHWILVLAENEEKSVREKARRLYDAYQPILDEVIDLNDVINTRIVYDDSGRKQTHALKHTTPEQFIKLSKKAAPAIPHKELLEALSGAAEVYEEKGLYAMAQQCYMRLYACNYEMEKTKAGLGRVFGKLGNKELAKWF